MSSPLLQSARAACSNVPENYFHSIIYIMIKITVLQISEISKIYFLGHAALVNMEKSKFMQEP